MTRAGNKRDLWFLIGLYTMLIRHNILVIDKAVYLLGAFICLFYIWGADKNKISKEYRRWVFTYVGFFLLSIIWSIKIKTSVFVFVIHLLPIFALSFATVKYINSYERLKNVLVAIFVCSLVMLCYLALNIDELLLGVRLGSSLNDPDDEDKLWNANVIGMTLTFAIFAGWFAFINGTTNVWKKIFYIFSAVLMIIAILLTGSRKTLIMLIIPFCYYLYKKSKKHFLITSIVLTLFGLLAYYLVMNVEMFYSTIGNRVEEMIFILSGDATGKVDDSRLYLTQYGLEWWTDNPILGIGINCFRVLSNETQMFAGKNFYAHNNYVELLVDVGIIGTLLYYTGHFYLFKESIKIKTAAASGVFIFVILILILDVFYVSYYDLNNQILMAILFAIIKLEKKELYLKNENSRYHKIGQH